METINGHQSIIKRLKDHLSEKQAYTILVIDDDQYFNQLIVSKISVAAKKIQILLKKNVVVFSYTNGEIFLNDLHKQKFRGTNLIVFLDYYLGHNLTGLFILNRLMFLENNPIVFILSDRADSQLAQEVKKAGAILFMHKNDYSPDICQVFLEELLI